MDDLVDVVLGRIPFGDAKLESTHLTTVTVADDIVFVNRHINDGQERTVGITLGALAGIVVAAHQLETGVVDIDFAVILGVAHVELEDGLMIEEEGVDYIGGVGAFIRADFVVIIGKISAGVIGDAVADFHGDRIFDGVAFGTIGALVALRFVGCQDRRFLRRGTESGLGCLRGTGPGGGADQKSQNKRGELLHSSFLP